MSKLKLFSTSAAKLETLVPNNVTHGSPVTQYRVIDTAESGRLSTGVWTASPGAWRVRYDEWEYCIIISGKAILTETGEAPVTVSAGDAFTLAAGFEGIWEVVETLTKHFVILDPVR